MSKETETTPIPKEELERARRILCRHIGSAIVKGMAYRDADFSYMGMRLDKPETYIRQCVHDLIEGQPLDLSTISDLVLALGMEWKLEMREIAA